MNSKYLIYLFTLLIAGEIQNGQASQSSEKRTCVILNEEFNNAYLYSDKVSLLPEKNVYAWDSVFTGEKAEYRNKDSRNKDIS